MRTHIRYLRMELRPYQHAMVSEMRREMAAGNKNILAVAPTGSGKTVMFSHILHEASKRGTESWIIIHRKELLDQTVAILKSFHQNPNVICSGSCVNNTSKITIAMVQTAARRLLSLPKPSLIVWDEAHHIAAKSYEKVFAWAENSYHIGYTATPFRLDGTGLRKYFNKMVLGPTTAQLIDQKFLSNYRYFCPGNVDTSMLHKRCGDWVTSEVEQLVSKPTITGCAIDEYIRRCNGAPAIVFCASIKHSQQVALSFNQRGIRAVHIDGATHTRERADRIADFRGGAIKVICNVDLFGEGFDVPGVGCAILLRPTASPGLYLQQVGRALRPNEGKEFAIINDHVGNCTRHGLPDDDRCFGLDGIFQRGRKSNQQEQDDGVRVCTWCLAANRRGTRTCEYCGTELGESPREIAEREGQLREIERERRIIDMRRERGQAKTMPELIALATKRGYKSPWFWAKKVLEGREYKHVTS